MGGKLLPGAGGWRPSMGQKQRDKSTSTGSLGPERRDLKSIIVLGLE